MASSQPIHLYLHFPFCRSKCAYCALLSRAARPETEKSAYVASLALAIENSNFAPKSLETVYFGGGTPSQCNLAPVFNAIAPLLAPGAEVSVEINPADASASLFDFLLQRGATRLSFGFQSLDDSTLKAMRRPHTARGAIDAFTLARSCGFENLGFDLIAGYPGVSEAAWLSTLRRAIDLAPSHASCYTLIPEPGTPVASSPVPSDDAALHQLDLAIDLFAAAGLERYEISNFARPGCECRHNLAVWHGADYAGLGEGASGRIGLSRTFSGAVADTLSPERDRTEREIFALRTRAGLDSSRRPEWLAPLERFAREGLVFQYAPSRWRLTRRGTECCDSILQELV